MITEAVEKSPSEDTNSKSANPSRRVPQSAGIARSWERSVLLCIAFNPRMSRLRILSSARIIALAIRMAPRRGSEPSTGVVDEISRGASKRKSIGKLRRSKNQMPSARRGAEGVFVSIFIFSDRCERARCSTCLHSFRAYNYLNLLNLIYSCELF